MDDSVEILGEVSIVNQAHNSSELEVIYDASVPIPQTRQRPVRKRKPVRTLWEEQQDEGIKNQLKSLKRQRQAKVRPLLRLSAESPSTSKTTAQIKPNSKKKALKRKSSISICAEVQKAKKPRPEVGGAGTVKGRKNIDDDDIQIIFEWDPASVISERQQVEEWQARNVINMFDKENTLPFIARYRKENTGNLAVEKLREIQNAYSQLKLVKEKVSKIIKKEDVIKKLHIDQKGALLRATTVHEVEHLTASLKGGGKRTFAERARELGLDPHAKEILQEQTNRFASKQELGYLINPSVVGLKTVEEVEQGLKHILADIISKDSKVLEFLRHLMRNCKPFLECSRKQLRKKENSSKAIGPSEDLCAKYENYFNYKNIVWHTRSHQILAMNRGEKQNVLSMKVIVPEGAYVHFFKFCQTKWVQISPPHFYRRELVIASIEDSWERLVRPYMQRHIRSQLTEMAEIASVEVFTSNLKKLLLTPPVRGKTVLAIDPGFRNGCKVAVTDIKGDVILTTTIYPFRSKADVSSAHWSSDHNARTLREIVLKHGCELFAVGNGTACRQMETYLSWLIKSCCFEPYKVQYTIINESGASQYSISPEAKSEFPTTDPNHISAISLCRRLQDPLLEYVKVHPMHLGVGMYQHDIPERLLNASLDSVMIESVSFVGVDINVASEFVLRKLSGLSKTRAANIIEHRKLKGPFINREQLKSVKGIGPCTFEQCAGFVRVMPETLEQEIKRTPASKRKGDTATPCSLDRTTIHPESYDGATRFMSLVGLRMQDIGSESFIKMVCHFMQNSSLEVVARQCGTTISTMQLIVEGLSQPFDFDIRAQFEKPLFREGVSSFDDLCIGAKLTGRVGNVTHFGAFVDIGVGRDGLIYPSRMKGKRIELGNVVEVVVCSLDKERGRIGLQLEKIIG